MPATLQGGVIMVEAHTPLANGEVMLTVDLICERGGHFLVETGFDADPVNPTRCHDDD